MLQPPYSLPADDFCSRCQAIFLLVAPLYIFSPQTFIGCTILVLDPLNLIAFLISHYRQLNVPQEFIEQFQGLSQRLEECAAKSKEAECNVPEVRYKILLINDNNIFVIESSIYEFLGATYTSLFHSTN